MAITSITLTPVNQYILTNQSGFPVSSYTQQYTAVAHFSSAPDLDITIDPASNWASDNLAVATVSNSGITKGFATALTISGSTNISITYSGVTATTVLRVGIVNYTRIFEQVVDLTAARNPSIKLNVFNFSLVAGGVTMQNALGASAGFPIGWTIASGHSGNFTKQYNTNEEQFDGYWAQLNSNGSSTTNFSSTQRSLGVITSIPVDINGNQLPGNGTPVLIQIAGEAYVFANGPITRGDFLVPDSVGKIKATTFLPASPTPIIGFALETLGVTYANMVLMRIQLCGE